MGCWRYLSLSRDAWIMHSNGFALSYWIQVNRIAAEALYSNRFSFALHKNAQKCWCG